MLEPEHNPYASIPLGFTQFDWSDPNHSIDSIAAQLLGLVDYWDEPEYDGMEPWEIERTILFEGGRKNWAGKSKHDKDYYRHMLCLAKLMFPQTYVTPALHDIFAFFCTNLTNNRKGLHLIGSQNAGKSFGSCILSFIVIFIDPSHSNVFIANPKMKTSEGQVWGTIKELWMELRDAHPSKDKSGCALFPDAVLYRDRILDLVPSQLAKGGKITLQDVKEESSFRGVKAFGKDVSRGVVLLVVDEINMLSSHAVYEMVDNLQSQPAFQLISSQNYTDPDSLGGRITEPSGLYGLPDKLDDLDIEKDQYWASQKSSMTLRLDGHRSPNILANRNIYDKLFTLENKQTLMENGGEQSPSYYCQARSFPVRGNEQNSVLSKGKISQSRHADPYFVMKNIKHSLLFVDPAFGGQDSAVIGTAYFGEAETKDAEGNTKREELLVFPDYFHKIPLIKGAVFNDYWENRLREADIPLTEFTLGGEVSYEDQIAIKAKEWANKYGVRADCTGFDSSLRPDIVSSMNKVFGFSVHAVEYNLKPEGYMIQNLKANSTDVCFDRSTELAFLASDYFLTRQVRTSGFIETAILQLSRTHYETRGQKFKSENKKDYKARFSGKSPDHRDVLMGLCFLAARKGFRQNQLASSHKQTSTFSALLGKLTKKGKFV